MKSSIYRISISFLFTVLFLSYSTFSQSWNAVGTGTSGTVYASTVFNGELIIAGNFVTADGVTVNNIARWNGTTWAALGSPAGINGVVYALTIYNGQLVAGGTFTTAGGGSANNIARWNGTTWANFGLGTNNTVYALTVWNTLLRAGGEFTTAGGIACVRVGAWNGGSWQSMGAGCNNTVFALNVFNNELIIGGQFTSAGTLPTSNRIVRYTGSWTNLGTGVDNNAVLSLAVFASQLYVGGNFSTIGSVPVNNLARWTGTNWNTVGTTGTNGVVRALYTRATDLVLGGTFTMAGTTAASNIATWNNTTFGTLGTGLTGGTPVCNTATVWSNVLYAGGNFTTATTDNVPASNIAGYGAIPAAPILISPPDNSIGIPLNPLLDWSDVANATTYRVQLSANLSFSPLLVDVGLLGVSQYQMPTGILANDVTYFWRANATNGLGTSNYQAVPFNFRTSLVGIINTNEIPVTFALHQNYPNPFNPTTKIKFDLPQNNSAAKVLLEVYDAKGQVVETLVNTDYVAGKWEVDFDASGLSSGFYFYKINAGDFNSVNKMILVK